MCDTGLYWCLAAALSDLFHLLPTSAENVSSLSFFFWNNFFKSLIHKFFLTGNIDTMIKNSAQGYTMYNTMHSLGHITTSCTPPTIDI